MNNDNMQNNLNNLNTNNDNNVNLGQDLNNMPVNNIESQSMPISQNLNSQSIDNVNGVDNQTENQVLYDTSNSINDKPVEVIKKKATITINKELKTAIILALILFIFIMIMPSIVDLFY